MAAIGCTNLPEKDNLGAAGTSAGGCVDRDGDSFGENCSAGRDCNDFDPTSTNECFGACSRPNEGCACNGEAPVSCFLPESANADGTLTCREGTRSCRGGSWSACEGVHTYTVTPRQDTRLLADVFPRENCSQCEVNCFVARDPLEYMDAGIVPYANNAIEQIRAGGITLIALNDAAAGPPPSGPSEWPDGGVSEWPIPDAGPCVLGDPLDSDCDNVPNYFDTAPNDPDRPFDSPHEAIVMTTPRDQLLDVVLDDIQFTLRESDVYFLIDPTRNQNVERQSLINAINNVGVTASPTLLQRVAGTNTAVCYDADMDGFPDDFPAGGTLIDAIRCFGGDAHFGLGFFNEVPIADSCSIPFTSPTSPTSGTWTQCEYGTLSDIAFRNLFDMSNDAAAFRNAVWRIPVIPTRLEIAQAGTQALFALATGHQNDLYYGPARPAFGARQDCPAGTYGAACFRTGVLPITFMFTDTGQHNGPNMYVPNGYRPPVTPNTNPNGLGAPYLRNNLAIPTAATWGTPHAGGYRAAHVGRTGENPYSPALLSATPLQNQRLTFTGSTIGMSSDVNVAHMGGCGTDGTPDTFLAFDLAAASNVSIAVTETSFDSNGDSVTPPGAFPKALSLFTSLVPPAAYPIGTPAPVVGDITLTSRRYTTDTTSAGFTTGRLGNISGCGADGWTNEASFTFTVPAGPGVRLLGDTTASPGTVVDIYQNAPLANPAITTVGNTNDTFATAHVINATGNPGYQSFRGDTSAATLPSNVPAAAVTCGANAGARDAVYRFHVTPSTPGGTRRISIDTESPGMSSIDTVISLHYAPPVENALYTVDSIAAETTAINGSGAITATGYDIGGAENAVSQITGTTTPAVASFAGSEAYACFGSSSAVDQVVHFSLSSATSVRIRDIDPVDGYDPAIAIFGGAAPTLNKPPAPATRITTAAGTGEDAANAWDLGNPVGQQLFVEGATFTTTGKNADFNAGQFGNTSACNTSSVSRDVVYRFTPTQNINARIKIDGIGLAAPTAALFSSAPASYSTTAPDNITAANLSPVTLNAPLPVAFRNATNFLANDISNAGPNNCNMFAGSRDAIYRFDSPTAQTVTFRLDETDTDLFDPVLRLFPSGGTPPTGSIDDQTWDPNDNRNDLKTEADSNIITLTAGSRVVRRSDFEILFGGNLSNSTGGVALCGDAAGSRDAVYRVRLPVASTINTRATGTDNITLAIYNQAPVGANFGAAGRFFCSGNSTAIVDNGRVLPAGDYYFVIKAWQVNSCGLCGNNRQDDPFTLEIDSTPATYPDTQGASAATAQGKTQADANPISLTRVATRNGDFDDYGDSTDGGTFCGADQDTRDAVFRFNMATTGSVMIDASSGDQFALAIFPSTANEPWDDAAGTCLGLGGSVNSTQNLAAGNYYLVIKARQAGLFNWDQDDTFSITLTPNVAMACNDEPGTLLPAPNADTAVLAHTFGAGESAYLVVTSATANNSAYHLTASRAGFANMTCGTGTSFTLDGNSSMAGTQDVALIAGTTYYLVVKGQTVGVSGTHRITIQDTTNTDPDPTTCMTPAMTAAGVTQTLPAGDYWAVIKGTAAAGNGDYLLEIADQTALMGSNRVTPITVGEGVGCDNNSGGGNTSRIVATLTPDAAPQNLSGGDYWIVVKGATAADSGPYQLNIRDLDDGSNSNWVGCSGPTTPTFDRFLPPGNYTATIKGNDRNNGAMSAFIYDDNAAPTGTCYSPGTSVPLAAGRHILGIKGATAGVRGEGAYQVTVTAGTPPLATPVERAFNARTWANTTSAVGTGAGMKVIPMQSCEPGTDWGTGTGDPSAGGGTFNTCGNTYSGPLAAVLAIIGLTVSWLPFVGCVLFGIIALPFVALGLVQVNSPIPGTINNPANCNQNPDTLYASVQQPAGRNPPRGAWPQSKEIARQTGTVDAMGNPLAFWLRESPNSDTVAYEITRALYQVTENLSMDISMEMDWTSSMDPVYSTAITAVAPSPCAGGVNGPYHHDCHLGDQPRFRVQFVNPGGNEVGQNPDMGWNGAWPGYLRIMGDDRFLLDEIPVLLLPPIPGGMMMPPMPNYPMATGTYYQDIGTRECDGNNLPDWQDLDFTAAMAPGTRIEFEACSADDFADLSGCSYVPVATVTATMTSCSSNAACRGINGYCGPGTIRAPGGWCRTIDTPKRQGLCSFEAECPDGVTNPINNADRLLSDCVMGECVYDSAPLDLGAALGGDNFRRNVRVRARLHTDPLQTYAPELWNWSATYVCTPNQ